MSRAYDGSTASSQLPLFLRYLSAIKMIWPQKVADERHDYPERMTEDDEKQVDEIVQKVAAKLPFQVDLVADMGGPSMLQIDLGRRGDPNDPPDTASIDPTMEPVLWMLDVEGGRETIASPYGLEADARDVARWIASEAKRVGSPAAS
jgi:hypothetical protein